MKIVFENPYNHQIDIVLVKSLYDCKKIIMEKPINQFNQIAHIFSFEIPLSCSELNEIKCVFNSRNINLESIHTQSRKTAISANALKINTHYEVDINKSLSTNLLSKTSNNDFSHKGTIRSGDKISSNGNLFIVGDVNPGAQISAKKNIYVWGKLCGIAIAGKDGSNNSTISSLYLNPLQLRINNSVAIGPKEKPNNSYPEIALLEDGEIVIKPLLIVRQ